MIHNQIQTLIRLGVRFGSKADMLRRKTACPLYPKSGHVRCN